MTMQATTCGVPENLVGRISAVAMHVDALSRILLNQVEWTDDALASDEKAIEGATEATASLAKIIRNIKGDPQWRLDLGNDATDTLEAARVDFERHLYVMTLKKDDHLCGASDRYVAALAMMIESVRDLRATIITYDLRVG